MRGPGDILPRAAARFGGKTALITATRRLTYTELDDYSTRFAHALIERGVAPGDRVSILGPNCWEWIVAYHGILKAGAVVNPLNVMLTDDEVAYAVADCGASVVVGTGRFAAISFDGSAESPFSELLVASPERRPPDVPIDPAGLSIIGYTSGTTGRPKGAMQSQRAVLLNCALTATMHGRRHDDVVVTALPAPHVYGNVAINGTFLAGGTVVLMERFAAPEALELIARHRATLFEGVPAMYAMLLAEPALRAADLRSLRCSTVGGQTIAVGLEEAWEARSGAPLLELWGMTEIAGLGTTHAIYAPNVHGSIGVALPGIEVRVGAIGESARTPPPGEPGELLVRGPIISSGYWNNPAATSELLDADGWLHSGDVAYADETGHFFVVDRLKDVILTGGYNVYPAEIERVLAAHPAVAIVAVGRVTDAIMGEFARAYVVLKSEAAADEDALIAHCRASLAAYKLPRSVRFVDDLPRTSSGKLMRRKLSELDAGASAVQKTPAPVT